ncbi:MAG: lipoyl(octanoyl) transferase [candidate division Zixibacteria bacterium RBG_19FT_COMBO_42_43]|nr:MAG: lipoyl(octanoyl) transferase [candidate division Zixibacteria bacterium RBG_19FT_COMBO_42_43]
MMQECQVIDLGLKDYKETLQLQHQLVEQKHRENLPEILLLVEHNPVITLGRSSHPENILLDKAQLEQLKIQLHYIERGGDVTYHGPGQLVAYPIFDLNNYKQETHLFLRQLEEVIIKTVESYNLKAERIKGLTGVWVDGKKVASIGVAAKKWITFHGLALNVNTDLKYFSYIHPCGMLDKKVTSIAELLKRKVDFREVKDKLVDKFAEIFDLKMIKNKNLTSKREVLNLT